MKQTIHLLIRQLSSRSSMRRKHAVRQLARYLHHSEGYLARLSLHYVAEHDPSYTVRNIARQAFYRAGEPPEPGSWERAFFF